MNGFGAVVVGRQAVGRVRCHSRVGYQLGGSEIGSFSRWRVVLQVGPGLLLWSDVFRCDESGTTTLCLDDVEFLEATRQAIAS